MLRDPAGTTFVPRDRHAAGTPKPGAKMRAVGPRATTRPGIAAEHPPLHPRSDAGASGTSDPVSANPRLPTTESTERHHPLELGIITLA